MTDITELAQSLKAAAENAIGAHERLAAYPYGEIIDISQHEGEQIDIDITDLNEFNKEANPVNVLALVEALEKAQRYIEELREWNAGLAQESFERQQRISELLEGKVGNALLERENHHVEVVGKLTDLIEQLETRTVEMPKRSLGFPHGYLLMPFPYYDAEEVEKALEDAGVKWSAKR
ncbi:TPA: ead/Ea22-like family protein [Klebsiella variicola subsp. variicola]|nr:ead/Ea22-like family protein [Klebsiella variicola subsp. variicola]